MKKTPVRMITLVHIASTTKASVLDAKPSALIAPICYDRARYISILSVSEHGTPKKPLTHLDRFVKIINLT